MDISSNKASAINNTTNTITPIVIENTQTVQNSINNNNIFDVYIRTEMKFAYGYSNFIKLLSSIKLFFCFISTLFQSYFYMYSFLIPFIGYLGAVKFSNVFNYIHIFLIILHSINNITYTIYFYSSHLNKLNFIYGFTSVLDLIVCLWVIRIVYVFSKYINKLTEEEILFLKTYKKYEVVLW